MELPFLSLYPYLYAAVTDRLARGKTYSNPSLSLNGVFCFIRQMKGPTEHSQTSWQRAGTAQTHIIWTHRDTNNQRCVKEASFPHNLLCFSCDSFAKHKLQTTFLWKKKKVSFSFHIYQQIIRVYLGACEERFKVQSDFVDFFARIVYPRAK